jgi:site-specific DNA-methyltransferase (adenine-specific)
MKPYYEYRGIAIYHGDCREILPQLAAIPWPELLITDPPYGAKMSFDSTRFRPSKKSATWWANPDRSIAPVHTPVIGDDQPFDPGHLLRFQFRRFVLFGANHYASRLPDSGGWLVWDKRRGIEECEWPMSEAELAWTNFGSGVRFFRHRWFGLIRDSEKGEHYHPTQKPIALMKWCIEYYGEPGDAICDPYCGVGPVLLAAQQLSRKAIGIEIEEKYCEIAAKRLDSNRDYPSMDHEPLIEGKQ